MPTVTFPYYARLSAADKRTYRQSDRIASVELDHLERLRELTRRLEAALGTEDRARVQRASKALTDALLDGLDVPRVVVKVLSRRPRDRTGELQGLYTWEEGKAAQIEVWMRTAEHRRVVAFRTYLRTLPHEICHHLDFSLLGLPETFHTEGFFQREASLFRQLVVAAPRRKSKGSTTKVVDRPRARKRREKAQLELFGDP